MIQIFVAKNLDHYRKQTAISISRKVGFGKILKIIANKLNTKVVILFDEDGSRVESTDNMTDNQKIYASGGESFYKSYEFRSKYQFLEDWKNYAYAPGIRYIGSCNSNGRSDSDKSCKDFTIGMFGDFSVGKTMIVQRYTHDRYTDDYNPTIEDVESRMLLIYDEKYKLNILDTTGMDEFIVMRPGWFHSCQGIIFVYAIDNRNSFKNVENFHNELRSFVPDFDPKLCILVGSKADLCNKREVDKSEAIKLANSWGTVYFEVSAKFNFGIYEAFESILTKLKTTRHRCC